MGGGIVKESDFGTAVKVTLISIEIYIIQKNDEIFLVTDDGVILSGLQFDDFDLNSDKWKKILDLIIASYGITN